MLGASSRCAIIPGLESRLLTAVLLLYSLTLFVGATLLFVVQPMAGKMILPLLGGTQAVWSTCMVFFQAALLAGYAYAYASSAWLSPARQALVHGALLALPFAVLPLRLDLRFLRGGESTPALDVLLLLSTSVGLPFLVVSATAPMLQSWFAHTRHRAARDPYFLYAASNLGSLLALLSYPVLIEPRLPLAGPGRVSQTGLWTLGYLVLAALMAVCALVLWRSAAAASAALETAPAPPEPAGDERVTLGRRVYWAALAFVPSSLLLGATTYITTDIAAVPLLWVLPLAVYLATFILAFGRWPARAHRAVVAALLPAVLIVLFLMVSAFRQRIWVSVLCHLALLFVVGLACHGELAARRPAARRLTEFYLLISMGGVLGGLFNALVAPAVFRSTLEYPLVMVLACVLVHRHPEPSGGRGRAALVIGGMPLVVAVLAFVLYAELITVRVSSAFLTRDLPAGSLKEWIDSVEAGVNKVLVYGPPIALAFLLRRRPLALGLGLVAVLLVSGFVDARNDDQIHQARSFFGVVRVNRDRGDKGYTELRHGTTLHGRQSKDPDKRLEPLSYYYREGPIGQLFAELDVRVPAPHVAVIGLGTGTLAAYARTGDAMTFFEIDRVVRDIALDPKYFTYVTDAQVRGARIRVELGDARIRLEAIRRERPGERYDLIIVDAFSSDAIPVHLLTREALRLYFDMLTPRGLLLLHLSNRHLDLPPVVANLAEDARLGGRLLVEDEPSESAGASSSTWALLARTTAALGPLAHDERWTTSRLEPNPRIGVWTDDFHNLLAAFRWK